MRLLLDTSVVLLAATDPARLGRIVAAVEDAELVLVPTVVTWELAIKASIGRLTLDEEPAAFVDRARTALGARGLPVTDRHASAVRDLPLHHRDPFDRLLVATAQVEDVALATTDVALAAYDVPLVVP